MAGVKGRSGGALKKSLREKQLSGSDRKSDRKKRLPEKVGLRIGPMTEILGDVGRSLFEYYEPILYRAGITDSTDAIALNMLCRKYEDWFKVVKLVQQKGRFSDVLDKDGNMIDLKIAPWAKLETTLYDQLMKSCREFGLTPVSRDSIERIIRNEKVNTFGSLT